MGKELNGVVHVIIPHCLARIVTFLFSVTASCIVRTPCHRQPGVHSDIGCREPLLILLYVFAFIFLLKDFVILLLSNYVCGFVHKFSPCRDWKKAHDPLELELQVSVSCPTSLQGIEPGSFGQAVCALN